jgi:hypothetical protein
MSPLAVCSSSSTPSLWSTVPELSRAGHVRQLPDMQLCGRSMPASIAASSTVVSGPQRIECMAPSQSMVTRKPSPAAAAAGAAGAAGAAAGGATTAAAATGAATAAAGLGGGGGAVLPWLARKDEIRASAADTL